MTRHIHLTGGMCALVADVDYPQLARWRWRANCDGRTWYAIRTIKRAGKNVTIYMHREIMDASTGQQVDHIDHNGLNNQRENLRLCTSAENHRNQQKHADGRSPYKGIYFESRTSRWVAQIWINKRNRGLGTYDTPEEAARAYDRAARTHFGEFAKTNFTE